MIRITERRPPDRGRRHRHLEFRRLLETIDAGTPAEPDLHPGCDDRATHKTPEIKT
jgi:hypothetical protein